MGRVRRCSQFLAGSLLPFLFLMPVTALAIRLDLASVPGSPGSDVTIPITLNYDGVTPNISGTSNDIGFNPSLLENPSATLGSAGSTAGKMVLPSAPSSGLFRVGVIGLNQNIIQNGIVAYVTFHVKANAPAGNISLGNLPSATDPNGKPVALQGSQGAILINTPPVASDQAVTTGKNTPKIVTLTATDADGDPLTYSIVSGPSHGALSGSPPAVSYAPASNYTGSDSFTFKVNDGKVDSNVATVSIMVTTVNTPPVASDQAVTTSKNTPKAITLTAMDADGDPLTYSTVSGPSHGALGPFAVASLTYTPATNYTGSDSFTFKANDGKADSNIATVSITVTAVNTPPVASDQTVTTSKNTAKAITLTATDADGDPLTYSIISGPSHGALSGSPPSVSYTPASNYTGSDSVAFKANDGKADSNVATVSITVTAVNTPPVASDQAVTTSKNTSKAITLSATDADGDPLTYSIVSGPSHGALSGSLPGVTYTPASNYAGSDSLAFKANDGKSDSNIATVSITVVEENLPVNLITPSDGAHFDACSLYSSPQFTWEYGETFASCKMQFSQDESFSSPFEVKISGTTTKISVKSTLWKKVLALPGLSGGTVFWRVVGIRANKSTALSGARSFLVEPPGPVTLNNPPDGSTLSSGTPPSFDFNSNCSVRFRLEFSSVKDFSDSTKIKGFSLTTKDPAAEATLNKKLTSGQWKSVKALIGAQVGYFRIKTTDGIGRETVSEVRSFNIAF